MNREQGSLLLSGVPVNRVTPETRHIERNDELAEVIFNGSTDQVKALITPQDAFRRTHEFMHAKHTSAKRNKRVYAGIRDTVMQITEDCKIHVNHWPWQYGETPETIMNSVNSTIEMERRHYADALEKNPEVKGSWQDYAMRLRQAAILGGIRNSTESGIYDAEFETSGQRDFARTIFYLLQKGREGEAARLLQAAFFEPNKDGDDTRDVPKVAPSNGVAKGPQMEIIQLPLTEHIPEAVIGHRRATSGSRLHRPSLRKPIIPQRLFIRKAAMEPGGTILVDASGSMGSFEQVTKWCEKAPFGTIAYYAGNGCNGWLWIYAKGGKRSANIVEPPARGNTVDGLAITWLMSQAKPRIMITDRVFCDAMDSEAQVMRLANLERRGEIKVLDYRKRD